MTPLKTLSAAALLACTLPAFADDPSLVKEIDVKTELSAVSNQAAAAYWANVDADLKNAIASRLDGRIGDTGAKIEIDIEEISLSNGFTEKLGLADTRLVGDIGIRDDDDSGRNQFYALTVDINSAPPKFPDGMTAKTAPADTRVYYDAMIEAFANHVVDNLR